jgi:hypothetical protein
VIASARPKVATYADALGDVGLALESEELHGLSEAEAANRPTGFGPNLLPAAFVEMVKAFRRPRRQ